MGKKSELSTDEFVALRKKLGYTQLSLARELDITQRTVQIYERKGALIPRKIVYAMRYLARR
jgi:transcriptional regulator with XRE-family HTH domain